MEHCYILKQSELKKRRIELGVTTERMAKVLDIPETRLKFYEDREVGLSRVTYKLAEEISWFFHCEVSDIAYYEWG